MLKLYFSLGSGIKSCIKILYFNVFSFAEF